MVLHSNKVGVLLGSSCLNDGSVHTVDGPQGQHTSHKAVAPWLAAVDEVSKQHRKGGGQCTSAKAMWDGEALVQMGWTSTELALVEFTLDDCGDDDHGQRRPIVEVAVREEVVSNAFLTLRLNGLRVFFSNEQ